MAAGGVNKVILLGNLGQDPDIRYTQGGTARTTINVATTRKYRDRDGQDQETTDWHRIVAFGRLAEIMGEYLGKGAKVYIEGRLQTRSWQDNQGQTRYITEVIARDLQMLGGGGGRHGGGGGQQQSQESSSDGGASEEGDFEDDIPF